MFNSLFYRDLPGQEPPKLTRRDRLVLLLVPLLPLVPILALLVYVLAAGARK